MTEDEDKTYMRRFKKFCDEGMNMLEAEDLAWGLLERDREAVNGKPLDDRRVCFECKHLNRQTCMALIVGKKRVEPYRFVLQRCEVFSIKGQ